MNSDLAFTDGLILSFWIFFTEPMISISPTFGTIFPFCLSQSSRYNNKHANLVIPAIFGCCRLVFHRVNGSPQTEAASFLANLFSLVVKSPPGCLCWPSQHHGLPPLFFHHCFFWAAPIDDQNLLFLILQPLLSLLESLQHPPNKV